MVAQHKRKNESYEIYLGWSRRQVPHHLIIVIIYAVGDDVLAPLQEDWVEYGNTTCHAMIKHLRDNVCIKMTTVEKERTFASTQDTYIKPWDTTQNIITYFKYLEDFQLSLEKHGISTCDGRQSHGGRSKNVRERVLSRIKIDRLERQGGRRQDMGECENILHNSVADIRAVSNSPRQWPGR